MKRTPAQPSSPTAALGSPQADTAKKPRTDRGAAALEFALVMPLLLVMVLGIVEFGRAYNVQTTLSGAAREGARVMALSSSPAGPSDARTAAMAAAAPVVTLNAGQISVSPSTCAGTGTPGTATVVVTYPLSFITNFFGASVTLTGKGVMRCSG